MPKLNLKAIALYKSNRFFAIGNFIYANVVGKGGQLCYNYKS